VTLTVEGIIRDMRQYLAALPERECPVPLLNWSFMLGIHDSSLRYHLDRDAPGLVEEYLGRKRAWTEGFHAELFALPVERAGEYRQVAERWGSTPEQAQNVMKHARKTGRLTRPQSKSRINWHDVVSCARVGMTREELAAAAGISVRTLHEYAAPSARKRGSMILRASISWRLEDRIYRIAEVRHELA